MLYSVNDIKKIVGPIAQQYGVERMWLFGSYARNEATPDSDLDFRVDKGKIVGYFTLAGFYRELEEALGMKLDLLTTDSLDDDFLEHISKYEVLIYEQQPQH
jgi:predicted nucleotidyltransferase